MRKFLENKRADVGTIGACVAILVTIMISVLIVYNIAASIDAQTLDTNLNAKLGTGAHAYARNATDNTLEQAETFYTIAPLIVIVLIAVVILGYVMQLARRPGP